MTTLWSAVRKSSLNLSHSNVYFTNWFVVRLYSSKINIPKRIQRGPTDILRALESTIERDPTAAHYKYHDDPYLIPRVNYTKRMFAMAQESGRKTAHWIKEQHPELFQHREADPFIQSFAPTIKFTPDSKVAEEDLKHAIEDTHVSDASLIYKLLKKMGAEINNDTQLNLLELLCFYNGDDAMSDEFIEEKWFKQTSKEVREQFKKTWKDGGLAEEVFISIENPPAEAYSAIIQGMAKYYQADRAFELFEEAKGKGHILNTDVYNSIIRISPILKEGYDLRWSFVVDLLNQMSKAKLKPNLGTLNAVLRVLSTMGGGKLVKENVLKTLAEFKNLGVEPSLASWYYVLIAFCKDRGPKSGVLFEILKEIENKEFTARDIYDTYFFVTAMEICRYHLHSKDAAERVHNVLMFKDNYNLIGDSYKESIYYRHYTSILCSQMPIEEFMSIVYSIIVPNIYIPEPSVVKEILDSVEATGSIEFLPKLWQDIVSFDYIRRNIIIETVPAIMANNEPPEGSELHEQFAIIARDIIQRLEALSQDERTKISLSGEMFGNLIRVLLRDNDFNSACTVLQKLMKGQIEVLGVPKIEDLQLFIEHCEKNKAPTKAIDCVQYAADSGHIGYEELASKIIKLFTLDENHLNKLSKIVGPDILHQQESVSC
ncbi:protein PTCD3 homolog, mitochondrial [Agrilus planipennis]|uniref:Protein PTCD3 homolog, mitochondrial n=1 Tax=Agrilus planipennis TaxID=224129 RepID=A0A1W4X4P3_AGRPL|nr:protein PTCD3 homolog, mitochondrial [Agrilus planipennis]